MIKVVWMLYRSQNCGWIMQFKKCKSLFTLFLLIFATIFPSSANIFFYLTSLNNGFKVALLYLEFLVCFDKRHKSTSFISMKIPVLCFSYVSVISFHSRRRQIYSWHHKKFKELHFLAMSNTLMALKSIMRSMGTFLNLKSS